MSRFTNDTDTLREMLSQGIPQMFSSSVTIIGVFILMCILSPVLTALIVVMVFVITFTVKLIGVQSAKYFKRQQKAIGAVNGYIEEMIEGQKVVKVFCHEEKSKAGFEKINEELFDAASNANTFASVLGPITNNFSYINYALTATIGAALAVKLLHVALEVALLLLHLAVDALRGILHLVLDLAAFLAHGLFDLVLLLLVLESLDELFLRLVDCFGDSHDSLLSAPHGAFRN